VRSSLLHTLLTPFSHPVHPLFTSCTHPIHPPTCTPIRMACSLAAYHELFTARSLKGQAAHTQEPRVVDGSSSITLAFHTYRSQVPATRRPPSTSTATIHTQHSQLPFTLTIHTLCSHLLQVRHRRPDALLQFRRRRLWLSRRPGGASVLRDPPFRRDSVRGGWVAVRKGWCEGVGTGTLHKRQYTRGSSWRGARELCAKPDLSTNSLPASPVAPLNRKDFAEIRSKFAADREKFPRTDQSDEF
jgi:hypothetical protein